MSGTRRPLSQPNGAALDSTTRAGVKPSQIAAERRARIYDEMTPATRRLARLGGTFAALAAAAALTADHQGAVDLQGGAWAAVAGGALGVAALWSLRPRRHQSQATSG